MRIKNIFRRKKYIKSGVTLHDALRSAELNTTCDECARLEECKEKGGVQEISKLEDTREYYLAGYKCLKNPYAMADIAYKEYIENFQKFQSAFIKMGSEGINWKQLESISNGVCETHDRLMDALDELFGGLT